MATIGPFKLNGGWVSDGDVWNPPSPAGLTYQGFMPWLGGAKTMDGFSTIYSQLPTGTGSVRTPLGFIYWQDPAQEGVSNRQIAICFIPGKCLTTGSASDYSTAWTDRTGGATLPTGNQARFTFDILNSIVICADAELNGSLGPFKITAYNGNVGSLGGSPPHASIIKVVNNFAFLACDLSAAANMSRIYWSNVADPETWGASNYVDFRKNDGDIITGLSAIGSDLIIFKTNSIGRLSTTSNVVAGSVTLGPLTEISTKIGCAGPLAHDTMPDGTLVFFATDGHVYQTDGSTFSDLSHQNFPKSNIRNLFPNALVSGILVDPLYYVQLKVDPSFNRLFIMVTTSTFGSSQTPIYMYDYKLNTWADWTELFDATNYVVQLNQLPSRASLNGFGAPNKYVYFGLNTGYLYSPQAPTASIAKPDSSTTFCIYDTSIDLGGIGPPKFIPRGAIIPIRQPNGVGGSLSVHIGYDGTYNAVASLSATLNTANHRYIVPIFEHLTSLSSVHPATIQIKITLSGATIPCTIIEPFYLTDEVAT